MAVVVEVAVRHEDLTDGPRRQSFQRLVRWALALAAFVLFSGAVAWLAHGIARADGHAAAAQRSLTATRREVAGDRKELASIMSALHTVNVKVYLSTVTLADDSSQLQATRAALTDAQGRVSRQGYSITSLRSCLGGVEQALNALSVADRGSAIDALDRAQASCQDAVASLG